MLDAKVAELLNNQVNKEFYSAYLYLDFSVYFDDIGLDGFANWYQIQAQEERDHAMLFLKYLQNNGCKVIGVSGNPNSWLAKHTDAFLFAGVKAEGGPLNRAPRNSVLAELLTLQALSVALQVEKDWDPVKYVRCHPGGKLGELRENEK